MTTACRAWWRNCAINTDDEMQDIDRMEDNIAPLSPAVSSIRELISSFEICHHKAERWVHNIIEAIGTGETHKGLGTRPPGQLHPVEKIWQNVCASLSSWCSGHPGEMVDLYIGSVPSSRVLAGLGERSALKEWQVQRVFEKVRSFIRWPHSCDDPAAQYTGLLLEAGEYDYGFLSQCPEQYKEHEDFWVRTVRTVIHDSVNGNKSDLSLGIAIDMLWPCHWRFVDNLMIVLEAIGGRLYPEKPFAACGSNISLLPIGRQMEVVCNSLKVFCGEPESNLDVNSDLLALLGKPTEAKKWLAASLGKTIRLQMNPPAELRRMYASALAGPEWIKQ
jgi:hypothetical protein